jgi:hypothetical protein
MEWVMRISTYNKKSPAICPAFEEFEELAKEHLKKASLYFINSYLVLLFSHFVFSVTLKRHLR